MPTPPSRWRSRSSPDPGGAVAVGRPDRGAGRDRDGPAVAGVIGERKFAYDVWGDTVNLASRLQEAGEPGEVLVSQRDGRRHPSVRVRARPDGRHQGQGGDTRASPHAAPGPPAMSNRPRSWSRRERRGSVGLRRILVALACCLGAACTSAAAGRRAVLRPGEGHDRRRRLGLVRREPARRGDVRAGARARRLHGGTAVRPPISGGLADPRWSRGRSISSPSTSRRCCYSSIRARRTRTIPARSRHRTRRCSRPAGSRC